MRSMLSSFFSIFYSHLFRKLLDYFSQVVSGEGGGGILLHGPPKTGKQAVILFDFFTQYTLFFPILNISC